MADSPTISAVASPARVVAAIASDIKLAHSVFALPFALLGMALAAGWAGRRPGWVEAGLIVACMVTARTAAMAMNRWADASIDARNPRTLGRAVPAGRVSGRAMLAAAAGSSAAFVVACAGFWWWAGNAWPVALSPVVLAWLLGYSFAKRWTAWCHAWLGVALALSAPAAAIAVEPGYLGEATLWWLALFVAMWVGGFDVLYALQDVGVDRREGLHSVPARLGVRGALWLSRAMHAVAAVALVMVASGESMLAEERWGLFAAAVGLTLVLLVVEHAVVARRGAAGVPMVFLTINGAVSLVLGAAGVVAALASVG